MVIQASQFMSIISDYFWPFCRVAAVIGAAPILGTRAIPVRIKIMFALAVTALIVPGVTQQTEIEIFSMQGLWVTVNQVLIGLAMGFSLQLIFGAFESAGQVTGQLMGLGFAQMIDPLNGVSVPVVSQFYSLLTTLLFLALNGHLVLIDVLASSFQTLPISTTMIADEGLWALVSWGSQLFSGAVLIAMPVIASLLIVNLSFGIMTRAAPQLNIFAVGFPVMIIGGFVVIVMALPTLASHFEVLSTSLFKVLRFLVNPGV